MKGIILLFWLTFATFSVSAQELISTSPITRSANMIFIGVRVNGSAELNFLFDTGAATTVVDKETATAINLKTNNRSQSVNSSSGTASGFPTFSNPIYTVGKSNISTPSGIISDLSGFTKIFGLKVDGIIGQDLLNNYNVLLDLDQNTLSIYNGKPENWNASDVLKLPFVKKNGTPRVSVTVSAGGKEINGRFLFDTGAGSALSCNDYFSGIHDLQKKIVAQVSSPSLDISGNKSVSTTGQIDAIMLGKYKLEKPAISVSSNSRPIESEDAGLLGMGVLGRFNMLFCNAEGMIYLSPAKNFKDPFVPLYQLGLGLRWEGDKQFTVGDLDHSSLAYTYGLRKGDLVKRINKISPKKMNDIYLELKKLEASDLLMEVQRDGKLLKIKIEKLKTH